MEARSELNWDRESHKLLGLYDEISTSGPPLIRQDA
jgi:hypothetical protein